jgi:lysophospholipase L1-like esterase
MAWSRAFPILLAFVLAAGCRADEPGPTTGSETHFLSWCSSDGSCEGELSCVCGVCTAGCSETSECATFGSSAECRDVGDKPLDQACTGAPVAATCEAACAEDADCETLGAELRCDRGFCRRLATDCTRGEVGASEVVLLGDSFFAQTHEITAELERLSRASGALPAGATYRDHSSALITPFGGTADLANQYATARDEGPVRVAIVMAGGPDLLIQAPCAEPVEDGCPALQNALAGTEALFQQMANDGVEAIVNVFYPETLDATLNERVALLRPRSRDLCASSPVSCHFLDLGPTFEGRSEAYLVDDGINPSSEGAVASAAVIWSEMQRLCLAQ